MNRHLLFVILLLLPSVSAAEEIFPGYNWREVSAGVYLHTRNDPFAGPVDGNSVVIVNEGDVFVVDTHINPAAARAVVEKIKSITDNPVSHIINTHWHDDHANGNQSFLDAFPDAQIIAHQYTIDKLKAEWADFENGRREAYEAVTQDRINEAAAAAEADDPDRAIGIRIYGGYVAALKPELPTMTLAYPDLAVNDQMVFDRGDRVIIVQHLGAGNTEGDLVVWLPEEQIVATGDIVVAPIPYAFDAPMGDWMKTLKAVKDLDANLIIPGHGDPQSNADHIDKLSALIAATLKKVEKARADGVAYEELGDAIDLSDFEQRFAGDDPVALNAWQNYFLAPGLSSAWAALGYPVPEAEE